MSYFTCGKLGPPLDFLLAWNKMFFFFKIPEVAPFSNGLGDTDEAIIFLSEWQSKEKEKKVKGFHV